MKNNTITYLTAVVLLFILSNSACTSAPTIADTTTSGTVKVGIDESFQSMMNAELEIFHDNNPNATIKTMWQPESKCIEDLLIDSVRSIVIGSQLSSKDSLRFIKAKVAPEVRHIAIDAIGLLLHSSNKDTTFTISQLENIFTGKIKTWNEINPKSNADTIVIVMDSPNSSNSNYLKKRFCNGADFPTNIYALHSNVEVMDYVKKHPNAIGVIGVNWISDKTDTLGVKFLHGIKIASLETMAAKEEAGEYCKPYQAYIALKAYPLIRNVYIIGNKARGLGVGLASFITSQRGQLIVKTEGLMPAKAPVRLIQLE